SSAGLSRSPASARSARYRKRCCADGTTRSAPLSGGWERPRSRWGACPSHRRTITEVLETANPDSVGALPGVLTTNLKHQEGSPWPYRGAGIITRLRLWTHRGNPNGPAAFGLRGGPMPLKDIARLRRLAAEAMDIGAAMTDASCKQAMAEIAAAYNRLAA